jgi:hypothetical protein
MALLGCPRYYWRLGRAAQKSIDEAAKPQQVIQRADEHRRLRRAGDSFEVRPVSRDQRLTSVRQNENKLQSAGHTGLPKDFQRSSMEWMMRTRDGHAFGKVLMMGSLSWFPSTTSRKIF